MLLSQFNTSKHLLLFIIVCVFCIPAIKTHAQINGFDSSLNYSLKTIPSTPAPHARTTVELNITPQDALGAQIIWYVDGVKQDTSPNTTRITFITGEVGTVHTIEVFIQTGNGTKRSVTLTVRPASIDLLLESDTHTPLFYRGRALPSSDAKVRAIALPFIRSTSDNPASYSYIWRLNNQPIQEKGSASVSTLSFTMPRTPNNTLSVEVFDKNGTSVGKKSIDLQAVAPEVYFYVDNPLRGIGQRAYTESYVLNASEATILAEPYFMSSNMTPAGSRLIWRLGGRSVTAFGNDPYSITLRKTGGEGRDYLDFELINRNALGQRVRGGIDIYFR